MMEVPPVFNVFDVSKDGKAKLKKESQSSFKRSHSSVGDIFPYCFAWLTTSIRFTSDPVGNM